MHTDEALLAGCLAFEPERLAEAFDRYNPAIYAYAYRQLGSAELAEDCASETFTRFLKALKGGLGPRTNLRAYLYRVAHNWITDHYRRQPPPSMSLEEGTLKAPGGSPEEMAGKMVEDHRLITAMRLLTAEQRQVVILRFVEGWGNEEVAEALRKPVGAVKALQHRALTALRRVLEERD